MKKKKEKFVDDGRVIANMDSENITGFKSEAHHKKQRELRDVGLTKEERRAIYKAAMGQFMPPFIIFVCALLIVLVLLKIFWLS